MSKTSIEWLPVADLQHCRTSGATMGTTWAAQFHAAPGRDLHAVVAEMERAVTAVDAEMSNWRVDSDLSRLNDSAVGNWVPVSANLARVLDRALAIGRDTGHAFNIGVGALVSAWGFGPGAADDASRGHFRPCAPLDEVLEVEVANRRARRRSAVAFDLCGIAKGFGVDELGRVLAEHGIGSWLVGIDGEMRSHGRKPGDLPWAIAIEAPEFDRRSAMGVIELGDAAIATSGDYRRWSGSGTDRISHTMDPRTGAPLQNGVASVTVVTHNCTDADAFATALMVLGADEGRAFAEQARLDALFVLRDGNGLRTIGAGCFAATAT